MLKTGEQCTWEEIGINEVFALKGCWLILVKLSGDCCKQLASTEPRWGEWDDSEWYSPILFSNVDTSILYKLPQAVQNLWREDE